MKFQVAPAEIEAVLHGHPAVLDCAVFGVPDVRAGELPVAAVQVDPTNPVAPTNCRPRRPHAGDLQAAARRRRRRGRPGAVVEVLRRTLRDEWLAGEGSEGA